MTNLDPKHLDALTLFLGKTARRMSFQSRDPAGAKKCQDAADTITALRAQIDRERAATIEAATQWHMDRIAEANRQIAENNEYLAKHGLTDSEANERCREKVWNSIVAIRAIRALHTDATRAAMDAIRREGYEAGVRDAAKLCVSLRKEADRPEAEAVGCMDCASAILALAASTPPDPDTNADSRQQTAAKDALIEAVRGGAISTSLIEDAMDDMLQAVRVLAAFDGSMDAAIELQSIDLLPGWWWRAGCGKRQDSSASVWKDGVSEYLAEAETPARALLLATLTAWRYMK